jgi:SAM-dependent methyltransferase
MSESIAPAASQPSVPVTPERILQFAWGYAPPLALEAAIRHRVFDVLDEGSKTIEEVVEATGASKRGLSAIMNLLVGLGFLAKADSHYALTPESSAFLVSTKSGYQGGLIRHTSEHLLPNWLQLNAIVATGQPAIAVNQQKDGDNFFEKFVVDIFPLSYPAACSLAGHLQLGTHEGNPSVLDLGAGSGVWSIAQAQSANNVRVQVVDWPQVLNVTRAMTARFGVADQYTFTAGDLLEADYGTGHTLCTIGHILHSEGEARSRKLLSRVFAALKPGGTVAIQEFLVNADRTGPVGSLIFAVNMLVNTDVGNTYSFEEIAAWLAEAGFIDARELPGPGPSPVILATKP